MHLYYQTSGIIKAWLKYPFTVYIGNTTKIRYNELTYNYEYSLHHWAQASKACSIAHEQRL